jgi:hypothetical protein
MRHAERRSDRRQGLVDADGDEGAFIRELDPTGVAVLVLAGDITMGRNYEDLATVFEPFARKYIGPNGSWRAGLVLHRRHRQKLLRRDPPNIRSGTSVACRGRRAQPGRGRLRLLCDQPAANGTRNVSISR